MKPNNGIAVDGACSGNPGPGEYRAIDLATGKELFRHKFNYTTNNIMEFCGIVHALKYNKEKNLGLQIYSDSQTGIIWTENKKCNNGLVSNESNHKMLEFIRHCELWLWNNTKNILPLLKWKTSEWGEIPADFGNKQNGNLKAHYEASQKVKYSQGMINKQELKEYLDKELSDLLLSETTKIVLADLIKFFNL